MRFNKKITLAVLACASPFFTGCSDAPSKGEQQEINDISNDRHLINKGVTNPKTLYVGHSEEVKIDTHEVVKEEIKHVAPKPVPVHKEVPVVSKKVAEVKKVAPVKVASVAALSSTQALKLINQRDNALAIVSQKDKNIAVIKKQRDEAIALSLRLKKDIDAKTIDLNHQIQGLKENYNEKDLLAQDKLKALALTISSAKELTSANVSEIKHINLERDAALKKVDLLDAEVGKLKVELDNAKDLIEKKIDIIDGLKHERDDAVSLTLDLKKDIDAKTADLNQEIQGLKQNYSENELSVKTKVEELSKEVTKLKGELDNSQKLLDDSKDLVGKKVDIIDGLKHERDEAVLLTLSLKKDIDSKTSSLNQEIQGLKQNYSDKDASEVEKLKLLTLELNKIKAQRDEAIKVTLAMEKKSDEFEAQASELNKKIQSLSEVNTQKDSLTDEKIQLITADLAKANELIAKNETDSKLLIEQRDDALKSLEDLNKKIAENESSSAGKIATAVAALTVAKQLTAKGQGEIDSLKERLAECDKALEAEKSARKGVEVKMLQEQKSSVINNIMSTFELSKVEFKTASSILTNDSTKLLDRVAKIMNKHSNYKYKIQGHTDSQGKQASNLKLSENRAKSVKDYLVSKGVDANILSSVGFGSSKPIADNKTPEGRSANRRVVFEILD